MVALYWSGSFVAMNELDVVVPTVFAFDVFDVLTFIVLLLVFVLLAGWQALLNNTRAKTAPVKIFTTLFETNIRMRKLSSIERCFFCERRPIRRTVKGERGF